MRRAGHKCRHKFGHSPDRVSLFIPMLNDAAEMFSNSAKHLFGIYMLFDIILYLCIFNNVIYMLFYILHEITLPIKKLYLST